MSLQHISVLLYAKQITLIHGYADASGEKSANEKVGF